MKNVQPKFSVVINTNGRKEALENTLISLLYVDYSNFEVIVVYGPSPDGTKEMLEQYANKIKVLSCPVPNLSMSRNIGIAASVGEFIAFIDDDAIPEAEWLNDLLVGYDSPVVAASGGVVFDHTGWNTQYLYTTANRLGNADWHRQTPADEYNFPLSNNFPYLQGTNTSFRREYLLEVGGFDEEIEFYLDETDVCCRLIDAGYQIKQLPRAYVHHKFLPSNIRNAFKVTRNRYPVLKNKIYFSIVNNRGHYTMSEIIKDANQFIQVHAADVEMHVSAGRLSQADMTKFWSDVDLAWERGLKSGLTKARKLLTKHRDFNEQQPFKKFQQKLPVSKRKVFVFFSQEYPPDRIGGIGTYTYSIASALADVGHHVHVLTRSNDGNTVDFEKGIWVHRLEVKTFPPLGAYGPKVPAHIWNYSSTMLEEALKINSKRKVTCLEAPIWDCEGISAVLSGLFPTVVSLHTTLAIWLKSHRDKAGDRTYMSDFGDPMILLERYMLEHSDAIHANSNAIVDEIERVYETKLDPYRTHVVHHGINDVPEKFRRQKYDNKKTRILYIGRLEERKGIDILIKAFSRALDINMDLELHVVGDDSVSWEEGRTFRQVFSNTPEFQQSASRMTFHGKISDSALKAQLATCDILAIPSRFESFGLTALEGFSFQKAVIASKTGGLGEVIKHNESGYLFEPENVEQLCDAIINLSRDGKFRELLAKGGRKEYEAQFSSSRMASKLESVFCALERNRVNDAQWDIAGVTKSVHLWGDQSGELLFPGSSISFSRNGDQIFLSFWRHPWSGVVDIEVGNNTVQVDLFSDLAAIYTVCLGVDLDCRDVKISRKGNKSDRSSGDEVILYSASWKK